MNRHVVLDVEGGKGNSGVKFGLVDRPEALCYQGYAPICLYTSLLEVFKLAEIGSPDQPKTRA